ncbi:DUF5990 family protein [Mucilaginibacter sp. L3T2-6]|uniref:DUF5990 family protein n=1 Tax=Mucilaginibacter sp. L3T2-6 TaxID=3062491 RepID=UPI0026759AC2|nr:DUF5990 family protein [Mucilaginibacter sp. L3T2-6]MDO3643953.1 DUF5990 family protein [Mucilaginibacter sp. L3T2-6]MDV6216324.1 DUF5990 family protein [Mucilaginibacter sp. L3T2-6]
MNLTLHIILQQPPAGIQFALQKGHGNNFEIAGKQLSDGGDLRFDLPIEVKGAGKSDTPQFGGPFVQGPAGEKFIYIGIGTFAGQPGSPWDRRLKVPLRNISWQMVNEAAEKGGLETIVQGTAKDGTPACATVKPFGGWRVA